MDIDYMMIFPDMFYDVDKDEEMNAVIEGCCDLLGSVIVKFGEILNEMRYKQPKEEWWVDVVVMLYVRKIVEHLDAIKILVEKCAFTQATIILRTLLESTVGLRFILKEETEKRAAAYYLYHHYEEMKAIKNFDEKTDIGKMYKKVMGTEKYNIVLQKCNEKKEALERLVQSNNLFAEVDKVRNNKIEENKKVSWYGLCSNVTNFKGMMKQVGWEKYYYVVYGGMSMEVHSYNAAMDVISSEDGLHMKLVRHPMNGFDIIDYVDVFTFSVLVDIYTYLKDGENEKREFWEYRQYFNSIKSGIEQKFYELLGESGI